MQTECRADLFGFASVEGRGVVAAFNGGAMTSDAGALLLDQADRATGLVDSLGGVLSRPRPALPESAGRSARPRPRPQRRR